MNFLKNCPFLAILLESIILKINSHICGTMLSETFTSQWNVRLKERHPLHFLKASRDTVFAEENQAQ